MAIKLIDIELGVCDKNHVKHIIEQFIVDLDMDLENQPEAEKSMVMVANANGALAIMAVI